MTKIHITISICSNRLVCLNIHMKACVIKLLMKMEKAYKNVQIENYYLFVKEIFKLYYAFYDDTTCEIL